MSKKLVFYPYGKYSPYYYEGDVKGIQVTGIDKIQVIGDGKLFKIRQSWYIILFFYLIYQWYFKLWYKFSKPNWD